ncbi:MAG: undecaprenyl/decaprenyl-phosphate alpha-N-acetylglucosaminyl 1-phosphate transferase [Planctomycetaceae bacterium]|jgi:UDP-GlcNAc:undecaprenyl-phosphate/decaprenyl-phosphate GlcNAc-1-phosphate transferase|nr:undecaprenyl/decaprenyl-phosphate alpha-N-acetylglucosaminyl 1-phosphate transferase [Planctomycetaceae bacterium]MBT6486345.1 undecaprenyl/decaprenyl-phosphate alpha-N-acetylglucosaminyl 1-phosphate transferase [Planctomycetaceae bacterium]MBT6496344.1 undecaprenyl/decaprenyl-phosphate alpha-N-acetylglucosaminyl 1-phosphate transferase [Planctomycetaceae bacterium]
MPADFRLSDGMDHVFWLLFGLTALALSTSYAFTAIAKRLARRWRILDHPDGVRKLHTQATPLMGGVAIFCSLLLTLLVARSTGILSSLFSAWDDRTVIGLLCSAGLFCLLGLYDDKKSIPARYKFLGHIVCSIPFAVAAQSIHSFHFFGIELELGMWSVVATIFWLVACANAINLLDGLDGLATVIGLTTTVSVTAMGMINGQLGIVVCALICTASIAGFLPHNWPPAKIFLGDSGSLTIGFLAGALSMAASFKSAAGLTLVLPIVCMSIPIFDTTLAILRRKLRGRKMSDADREHIHHRLQDRGDTRSRIVLTIGALSLLMATSSIASVYYKNDWIAALACVSLLGVVTAKGYFGSQEMRLLRLYWQILGSVLQDARCLLRSRIQISDRDENEPGNWQQSWQDACNWLSAHDGASMTFTLSQPGQNQGRVIASWKSESTPIESHTSDMIEYSRRLDSDRIATLEAGGVNVTRLSNSVVLFESFDSICRQFPADSSVEITPHLQGRRAA